MNAYQIHGLLKLANQSVPKLAKKLKKSRVAVYRTIKGQLKSPAIRQAIADAVGIPVHELWPDAIQKKSKARPADAKRALEAGTSKDSRTGFFLSNGSVEVAGASCSHDCTREGNRE